MVPGIVVTALEPAFSMLGKPSLEPPEAACTGNLASVVPVALAWRERRSIGVLLLAAIGPIFLIGLGLMLYNYQRFDNPFEFGLRYQLNGQVTRHFFNLNDLWFNFRVYFLGVPRWNRQFPFVQAMVSPPLPRAIAMWKGLLAFS